MKKQWLNWIIIFLLIVSSFPTLIIQHQPVKADIINPTVQTDDATNIGCTSATLSGTLIDDGGKEREIGFEYGTTTDYGNKVWSRTDDNEYIYIIARYDLFNYGPGPFWHAGWYMTTSIQQYWKSNLTLKQETPWCSMPINLVYLATNCEQYESIIQDNTYVYASLYSYNYDCTYILKISKSNMTWSSSVVLPTREFYGWGPPHWIHLGPLVILEQDENYIYTSNTEDNVIYQILKSDMTVQQTSDSYYIGNTNNWKFQKPAALDEDIDYLYASVVASSDSFFKFKIFQFWKSNLTIKTETEHTFTDEPPPPLFPTNNNLGTFVEDDKYLYYSDYSDIYQIWKSNMTIKTSSQGETEEVLDYEALIDDENYVYANSKANLNISRYWKSNMTYKDKLYALFSSLSLDKTYIYRASDGPTLSKCWKFNFTQENAVCLCTEIMSFLYYMADMKSTPEYKYYGTTGQTFSSNIECLEPCTTYHYRTYARNSYGESFGEDKTFTTFCNSVTVNVAVRYENETEGVNHLVPLNQTNTGEHKFIVHYTTGRTDTTTFDNTGGIFTVTTSIPGNYIDAANGNFTVYLNESIETFEFRWNDSFGKVYYCTRYLVPTENNITFYIRTDLHVYGESTLYFNSSLVRYKLGFLDETGYFRYPNHPKVIIYTYNSSGLLQIIHSEYFDASLTVHPWLVYGNTYYIGVSCDVYEVVRMGRFYASTDTAQLEQRIPFKQNISYAFFDLLKLTYGWFPDGLYVHYIDTTQSTDYLIFNVYYFANNTMIPSATKTALYSSDENFTYLVADGCSLIGNYKFQINATLNGLVNEEYQGTYVSGKIPIFAPLHLSIPQSSIDNVMTIIFGASPIYDISNPSVYVPWTYIILFIISFILLLSFGRLNAFIGGLSVGMFLAFSGIAISGISVLYPQPTYPLWNGATLLVISGLIIVLSLIGLAGGIEK